MGKIADFLVHIVDDCWRPQKMEGLPVVLFLGLVIFAMGLLVYSTGGTKYVYAHIMYVPIILGAFFFGVIGGCTTGVVGGLVLGPFMPLDVQAEIFQPLSGWLIRVLLFMLIGLFAGALFNLLQIRLKTIRLMVDNLARVYSQTLKTFITVVEARDKPTCGHCERVANNGVAVGSAMGFGGKELETLFWAGILHDLGKIAIPESILGKTGKLTEDEYELIKTHVTFGAQLLEKISPDFGVLIGGVKYHHEWWDGEGYPEGLAGREIPLLARILGVVDVFEALTAERPYREAWSVPKALKYIKDNCCVQFDQEVVEAFLKVYKEGRIHIHGQPKPTPIFAVPQKFGEDIIRGDLPYLQK